MLLVCPSKDERNEMRANYACLTVGILGNSSTLSLTNTLQYN